MPTATKKKLAPGKKAAAIPAAEPELVTPELSDDERRAVSEAVSFEAQAMAAAERAQVSLGAARSNTDAVVFRIMATHGLSPAEYQPRMTTEGLKFQPIKKA
jgi:hypothetical protein